MLKPAEMRELRIVALDKHTDGIIKRLDALGTVHITDIKEFLDDWEGLIEPSKAEETAIKAYELSTRINNLIALLEVPGEGEEGGAARPPAVKVEEINLEEIGKEFGELEETVTTFTDDIARLREELSTPKGLLQVLKALEGFGIDLDFVGEKDFTSVYVGKVPSKNVEDLEATLEPVTEGNQLVVSNAMAEGGESTGFAFAVVVTLKKDKAEVERALRMADFEPYQLPLRELPEKITDAIADVETRINRLETEIKDKGQAIEEIRNTRLKDLLKMRELVQIEESKAKVKILFGASERVRVIEGWTPKEEVDTAIEGISQEVGGFCVIEVREPKRDDVRVPTLLKNPRLVKPFESIIRMYSLPSYRDIDPTVITAVMFPVLFGLMFPDIGHGALLLLLGLALMFWIKGSGLKDMGWIIALCGVCSIGGGLLFGEFFGFSEYAEHLLHSSMQMECPALLAKLFIHEPLWFEPIPNVQFMFVISVIIGALHMGLGVFLGITNKLADNDLLGMIIGFVRVWCLFGALYFLLLLFGYHFTELQNENMPVLLRNAGAFVALPILLLTVLSIVEELKHEKAHSTGKLSVIDLFIIGITGVIDAVLENFFRFLANTISYGRILALALAHAALIEVFLLLTFMGLKINIVLAVVVFVLGTTVVVLLEGIMAGIHAVRLHYYEWFTKFYEGGGVEFSPFKFRRSHTE